MREQRLVFGEVADLYDRYRPTYPPALIDDLVSLAELNDNSPVLEIGAGTGKATRLFAQRRIPVVAVEPSPPMAAVAQSNCRAYPWVEIEQSDFEHWNPGPRRFQLAFSAQAWHWVDPHAGFAKVREALAEGGWLAVFWNRFAWEKSELRGALEEAYRRAAPGLTSAGGMHPGNLTPDQRADWEGEIGALDGLGAAEVRHYEWDAAYSTSDYVGLLGTASDVCLLDAATRRALFEAVAEVIDAGGGVVRIRMRTRLCLARRQGPSASTQSQERLHRLR